ncbi:hypothetical protein [Hydrogenophaga sp. 2FB]|uniref:hypothetical protein n=1 Tax=Hydrogenophaga sp. 2FB TaxID=2502187 RepID=UPI0010F94386|nr:hypothetical protein [Hydrogenophaga sp. 2FB]
MADWIKMRSSLLTNPRVTRMARVLLQDPEYLAWMYSGRDVTRDESVTKRDVSVVTRIVVGGLLPVWSMVNETAARDGVVRHASSHEVDDAAGIPGFFRALAAVEWAEELPDGSGVRFNNFEEHNSPQKERSLTGKSGAERTKEYRERKKQGLSGVTNGDAGSDELRDVTVTSQRDDREEKKREEKKDSLTSSAKLPTCPTQSLIDLYHEMLPDLPQVRLATKDRTRALAKAWTFALQSRRADGSRRAETSEQAVQWFRDYFARAGQNDFLMGRTPRSGEHANWRCDLDFLLTDRGMKHVIEKTLDPA